MSNWVHKNVGRRRFNINYTFEYSLGSLQLYLLFFIVWSFINLLAWLRWDQTRHALFASIIGSMKFSTKLFIGVKNFTNSPIHWSMNSFQSLNDHRSIWESNLTEKSIISLYFGSWKRGKGREVALNPYHPPLIVVRAIYVETTNLYLE